MKIHTSILQNMKTRILSCLLSLLTSIGLYAQTIQFNIAPLPEGNEVSQGAAKLLETRLKQILTRNSAGAAQEFNVFSIRPELSILEKKTTAGLVQNVGLVKGELTLIATNRIDGSLYHSVTIPISGQAKAGDDPYKAMVQSIRSTDPLFTRFIRVAREKIDTYYAQNCGVILQKAKSLYQMKKYKEARSYLSAISEALPCYDQASELLAVLPEEEVVPDTVVIRRVVEKPVIVEKPVVKRDTVVIEREVVRTDTVVVEKRVPAPTRSTPKLDYEISISETYLDFKVLSCKGNRAQRRIAIEAELTRTDGGSYDSYFQMKRAYNQDGVSAGNAQNGEWRDFPPNLKIKHTFYITETNNAVKVLNLVGIRVRSVEIEIRNLPVKWN